MISVSIPNSEFKKLKNQLGVFKKEAKIRIMQEVDKAALHVKATAQQTIQGNGTTNEGRLAGSIKILRQPAYLKARVFTDAGYGRFVEYGRKPGRFPPVTPLERWSRLKLGVSQKEAKGVAFLVARKIAREGTKPQPFMEPAMRSGVRMLNRGMKNIVRGI